MSCAQAILFTYVKDTIWSTVNLQLPAEPRLAALQVPNSQVQGWSPSIKEEVTRSVYKEGGGGPKFSREPPSSFWGEAAKVSLILVRSD